MGRSVPWLFCLLLGVVAVAPIINDLEEPVEEHNLALRQRIVDLEAQVLARTSGKSQENAAPDPEPNMVAFHLDQLNERGMAVSWFLLMEAVEVHLGLQVCILHKHNDQTPVHQNVPAAVMRFQRRFGSDNVIEYRSLSEIDAHLTRKKAKTFVMAKFGHPDGVQSAVARNVVVCVFDARSPHGDVYLKKSSTVPGDASLLGNIVRPPEYEGTQAQARALLNPRLPPDAVVFGCHGGATSFDIHAAQRAVAAVAGGRYYFVFLNIRPFIAHPNVLFLPGTVDFVAISRFITACDAMLHARLQGETFGNSVAEFAVHGKPIITFRNSVERAHLDILGDLAIVYESANDLVPILLGFAERANVQPASALKDAYAHYTPTIIAGKLDAEANLTGSSSSSSVTPSSSSSSSSSSSPSSSSSSKPGPTTKIATAKVEVSVAEHAVAEISQFDWLRITKQINEYWSRAADFSRLSSLSYLSSLSILWHPTTKELIKMRDMEGLAPTLKATLSVGIGKIFNRALEKHIKSTPSAIKTLEDMWSVAHIAKQNNDWPAAIQQCFHLLLELMGMVQGENKGVSLSAAFVEQANHSISLLIEFISTQESRSTSSPPLSPRSMSFSIPINKWERHAHLRATTPKSRDFSLLIPGDHTTYIYSDENRYITQYAESYFALTWKKAGYDALRHYEILLSGAIPYFMDMEFIPEDTMSSWPRSLISSAMSLPGVPTEDEVRNCLINDRGGDGKSTGRCLRLDHSIFDGEKYNAIRDELLLYCKRHLMTKDVARAVTASRQVVIHSGLGKGGGETQDYIRDLLVTGLIENGAEVFCTFNYSHLFSDHQGHSYNEATGQLFFGVAGSLSPSSMDRLHVIKDHEIPELAAHLRRKARTAAGTKQNELEPAYILTTAANLGAPNTTYSDHFDTGRVSFVDGNDIDGDHTLPSDQIGSWWRREGIPVRLWEKAGQVTPSKKILEELASLSDIEIPLLKALTSSLKFEPSKLVATEFTTVPNFSAFVINLERRPDRWHSFQSQTLPKLGIRTVQFPAIDGYSLLAETHDMSATYFGTQCADMADNFERNPRVHAGSLGRAYSHVNVWRRIVNHGDEGTTFAVFEDDVIPGSEWDRSLSSYWNNIVAPKLPSEWHWTHLSNDIKYSDQVRNGSGGEYITAVAYMITLPGARFLLNYVENSCIGDIDRLMHRARSATGATVLQIGYGLMRERDLHDSDIDVEYQTLVTTIALNQSLMRQQNAAKLIYEIWAESICEKPLNPGEFKDLSKIAGVPPETPSFPRTLYGDRNFKQPDQLCSLQNRSKTPIFFINLESRKDRATSIQHQFERENLAEAGFELVRFSAVDGRADGRPFVASEIRSFLTEASLANYESNYDSSPHYLCAYTGCKASHSRIWREVAECGYRAAIVLEDDVQLRHNLADDLVAVIDAAPIDAAVTWIGAEVLSVGPIHKSWKLEVTDETIRMAEYLTTPIDGNDFVGRIRPNFYAGTSFCAYIIHHLGARRLLEEWADPSPTTTLLPDIAVNDFLAKGNRRYMSRKVLATPNLDLGSDNLRQSFGALTRQHIRDLVAHYNACIAPEASLKYFGADWMALRCSPDVLKTTHEIIMQANEALEHKRQQQNKSRRKPAQEDGPEANSPGGWWKQVTKTLEYMFVLPESMRRQEHGACLERGSARVVATHPGVWNQSNSMRCPSPRFWIFLYGEYGTFDYTKDNLAKMALLSAGRCYQVVAVVAAKTPGSEVAVVGGLRDAQKNLFHGAMSYVVVERAGLFSQNCSLGANDFFWYSLGLVANAAAHFHGFDPHPSSVVLRTSFSVDFDKYFALPGIIRYFRSGERGANIMFSQMRSAARLQSCEHQLITSFGAYTKNIVTAYAMRQFYLARANAAGYGFSLCGWTEECNIQVDLPACEVDELAPVGEACCTPGKPCPMTAVYNHDHCSEHIVRENTNRVHSAFRKVDLTTQIRLFCPIHNEASPLQLTAWSLSLSPLQGSFGVSKAAFEFNSKNGYVPIWPSGC